MQIACDIGITHMLQLINAIMSNPRDNTQVRQYLPFMQSSKLEVPTFLSLNALFVIVRLRKNKLPLAYQTNHNRSSNQVSHNISCALELSVKCWYPVCFPLWSPPHPLLYCVLNPLQPLYSQF
jgi:hypothetical protein